MRHFLCTMFCISFLTNAVLSSELDCDTGCAKLRDACRAEWSKFLSSKFSRGQSEAAVLKLMENKYRDRCRITRDGHMYELFFLVDDFHQVRMAFDDHPDSILRGLSGTPTIEPRARWLRRPGGEATMVLTPEESAAQSKAQEVALREVRQIVQKPVRVLGAKHQSDGAWEVGVIVDSNEVDAPIFIVTINSEGEVTVQNSRSVSKNARGS